MQSAPQWKSTSENPSSFPNERRLLPRLRPASLIYVNLEGGNGGIILNLTEKGMAIQAVVPLVEDFLPRLRFQLPISRDWIETAGRVIWRNETKKLVGVCFEDISDSSRQLIREWVRSEEGAPQITEAEPIATAPRSIAEPKSVDNAGSSRLGPGQRVLPRVPQIRTAQPEPPRIDAKEGDDSQAAFPALPPSAKIPLSDAFAGSSAPLLVQPAKPGSAPAAPQGRVPFAMPHAMPGVLSPTAASPLEFENEEGGWQGVALVLFFVLLAAACAAGGWKLGRGTLPMSGGTRQQPFPVGADSAATGSYSKSGANVSEIEIVGLQGSPWTIPLGVSNAASGPSGPAVALPQPAISSRAENSSNTKTESEPSIQPSQLPAPAHPAERARNYSADAAPALPYQPSDTPQLSPYTSLPPTSLSEPRAQRDPDADKPKLLYRVDPIYPAAALQQHLSGVVRLRLTIHPDGTVGGIMPLSGPPPLVDAAINAARKWRYESPRVEGRSGETTVEIGLVFQLPR